jgi:hypothetical protein
LKNLVTILIFNKQEVELYSASVVCIQYSNPHPPLTLVMRPKADEVTHKPPFFQLETETKGCLLHKAGDEACLIGLCILNLYWQTWTSEVFKGKF